MANEKKTVVIVDDHPLFLEGIKSILRGEEYLSLVGEASKRKDAIELIKNHQPDIALLDIELKDGNGFEIVEVVKTDPSKTRIIFLTMYNDPEMLNKALNMGVKGFILKEHTSSEIIDCIKSVLEGKTYISPLLSDNMLRVMKLNQKKNEAEELINRLTLSEKRILKLISLNKTSKEIAAELNISPKTVENHRKNICEKLHLHGSHSLIKFAFESKAEL